MIRRALAAATTCLLLALPRGAGALMTLRPGDTPPPFVLAGLAGERVGSETLTGAVSVVLFWSTWSPRSAEMFEDFTRHAATYAGAGLRIVAINSDGENLSAPQREAIRAYAAGRNLPFPVLLDEGLKTFAAWGVMAHPTEVLLDRGGRIAYVLPGYPETMRGELEEAIRAALGQAVAPSMAQPLPAPPAAATAHANLGRRFLALGDLERAREAYVQAAAADPSSLEAAVMVARVSLALGSTAEAEALVRQAGPAAIARADLRSLLAALMLHKGDIDAAERAFAALRERLPEEGWGHWGLGLVALARGDHRAALAALERGARLQPENPEAAAFVRRHFRDSCLRQEPFEEEAGFARLFPALALTRERYCRVFPPSRPRPAEGTP